MLRNAGESGDYEDVSYDAESLFTSIPVKEMFDYITQKIYVKKEIKPFCKNSVKIFKKLLRKFTQECVFSNNNRLIKQVDGCPMCELISVVFSDIYVCKMEEDIAIPAKPIFYKRYVDDTYVRRKKHETDKLFLDLNSYHDNNKLPLDKNKSLDTENICTSQGIKTQVYNKAKKRPVHWFSKVPFKYKRNAITGELHRPKRIAPALTKKKQKELEVNTKTQDTQNMLLKTLSRILTKRKMSF